MQPLWQLRFGGSLVLVVDQVVVSVGILGVCAGVSWLCANGHVLGLRVLFRCDITSMSQRGVLGCFEDALVLATMKPRLSGSTVLVPATPSPLDYVAAFSTQCASVTPRVDVDVAMSGPRESLWLGNLDKSDGRRKERRERREGKHRREERSWPYSGVHPFSRWTHSLGRRCSPTSCPG